MTRGHAEQRASDQDRSARILLAEDDNGYARAVERLLVLSGYLVVVVPGANAALEQLRMGDFDLLLTDLDMPGNDRQEVLYHAVSRGVPTIILTGFPSLETAVEALRLGVVDYVTKSADFEELLVRVERVIVRQRRRASHDIPAEVAGLDRALVDKLSVREQDVVRGLASGYRVTQLALGLRISEHTVRNHLRSIFRKLEISSQGELIELIRATAP